MLAAIAAKSPAGDRRPAANALLDHADTSIRSMASALVRPLAAKLEDGDGGPAFLRIHADLLNPAGCRRSTSPVDRAAAMQRWRDAVEHTAGSVAVALHTRLAAVIYTAVELGRRAASAPHTDDRPVHQPPGRHRGRDAGERPVSETRALTVQRQARRAKRNPVASLRRIAQQSLEGLAGVGGLVRGGATSTAAKSVTPMSASAAMRSCTWAALPMMAISAGPATPSRSSIAR